MFLLCFVRIVSAWKSCFVHIRFGLPHSISQLTNNSCGEALTDILCYSCYYALFVEMSLCYNFPLFFDTHLNAWAIRKKGESWPLTAAFANQDHRSRFSHAHICHTHFHHWYPSSAHFFIFSMYMKSHEHAHLQLVIFLIFFMPVTPLFPNLEFQISKYREMWRKWAVWERFWHTRVTYTCCWSWKWRIAMSRSSSLRSRAGSSATLFSTRLLAILASSFNSSTPGSATPYIYIYIFLFGPSSIPRSWGWYACFPQKSKRPF